MKTKEGEHYLLLTGLLYRPLGEKIAEMGKGPSFKGRDTWYLERSEAAMLF